MKRLLFLYFLSFSISAFTQNDTQYHRVKVFLHDTPISTLAELGLEYDHGSIAKGRYWINDVSTKELNIIKENKLTYEILINDVQAWYLAQNKLPPEAKSRNSGNPSCIGIDLASQYETPVNYTYGSMGGYLTYQEMLNVLDSMQHKFPHPLD